MKKLHILVIRSYLGPFVFTFFIAIFVLLMQFLWKYIDDLVGKGLDLDVLSELLFYASATFVPMALPLAILLSSLMTFGNLGEYYELVALKSSGISLQRTMFPLIILSILISISAFFFANNVMPVANLKFQSLLYDVRHQRPELNIQPGIFYKGIDNFVIKVARKDHKTNMMYNVMIYDHTESNGNENLTIADSATMDVTPDEHYLILTMYDGRKYEELPEETHGERKSFEELIRPHRHSSFEKETIMLDLSGFGLKRTDEDLFSENEEMLNIGQLEDARDSLEAELEERKVFFGKNLLETIYFKREIKIDSLKPKIVKMYHYDVDSVYGSLSRVEKLKSLDVAVNFARSAQAYISTTADDYEARERWITNHEIEWHRKFSLSFACFVLFFIGAPLGAIIRKGGLGMPVVVAVLFFIVYYIITITGEKTVKEGLIPAYQGMWLSAFILLPLGIFLTYKATTDSVLFDISAYREFFKTVTGINWLKNSRRRNILRSYDEDTVNLETLGSSIRNLSQNIEEFDKGPLSRFTFAGLYKDLVNNTRPEEFDRITQNYRETFKLMVLNGEHNKYLREKLEVFPNIRLGFYRKKRYFRFFNMAMVTVLIFPAGLTYILIHFIKMSILKKKLRNINKMVSEIGTLIENPDFLSLKNR